MYTPNAFANRVLDETPKFLREKLAKAEEEAAGRGNGIGTSTLGLSA